jgi:hypothetical protein
MSSWRDDLPPIPAERIRAEAIREGRRRRENRQRRQRAMLVGGAGAVAVALIVVSGVLTGPGNDEDAADTADTSGAADATTPAQDTTPATEAAAATEEPAATEVAGTIPATTPATAPAGTIPAPETTAVVDYTTIGNPLPPSDEVSVVPAEIFEQGPSGPACGPSTLEVTFEPRGRSPVTPIVHWETRGVTGEAEMIVDGDVARATIGPFAPDTLDEGVSYEVLVYVSDIDSPGDVKIFRSPPVVLRDCSP